MLARDGQCVGELAGAAAHGLAGAALAFAVAVDEHQDGLLFFGQAGEGALEVHDADNAGVVGAAAARGPSFALVLHGVRGAQGGAVACPLTNAGDG